MRTAEGFQSICPLAPQDRHVEDELTDVDHQARHETAQNHPSHIHFGHIRPPLVRRSFRTLISGFPDQIGAVSNPWRSASLMGPYRAYFSSATQKSLADLK